MRPKGSAERLEARRRRAMRLLEEGRSLHDVADLIDCAASSVMRWRDAWRREGEKALHVRSSPGRPPKLTAGEQREVVELLRQGPTVHGYGTAGWTTARIAEIVARHFRVTYHPDHVGRLMHHLGWTHQRPPGRGEGNKGDPQRRTRTLSSPSDEPLHGWTPGSSPVPSPDRS